MTIKTVEFNEHNQNIKFRTFKQKWQSFGWNTFEIDGNNLIEIEKSLSSANSQKPKCIIANTTKGKGVSFMENKALWYYRSPNRGIGSAINEINKNAR